MDAGSNYAFIWLVYLAGAGGFFLVFWPLTKWPSARWISYIVRGAVLALALTPWYANSQDSVLAPALMVVLLDTITLGPAEAVRALIPLILGLMVGLISATVLYVKRKKSNILINNK